MKRNLRKPKTTNNSKTIDARNLKIAKFTMSLKDVLKNTKAKTKKPAKQLRKDDLK